MVFSGPQNGFCRRSFPHMPRSIDRDSLIFIHNATTKIRLKSWKIKLSKLKMLALAVLRIQHRLSGSFFCSIFSTSLPNLTDIVWDLRDHYTPRNFLLSTQSYGVLNLKKHVIFGTTKHNFLSYLLFHFSI